MEWKAFKRKLEEWKEREWNDLSSDLLLRWTITLTDKSLVLDTNGEGFWASVLVRSQGETCIWMKTKEKGTISFSGDINSAYDWADLLCTYYDSRAEDIRSILHSLTDVIDSENQEEKE